MIKFSALVLLISVSQTCFSFPSSKGKKQGELDQIPLFVLSSLPMQVDEPGNTIFNLPGGPPTFPVGVPSKSKKDGSGSSSGSSIFSSNANSCCPTVVEIIEPLGGKNRSGELVELYQGDGVRQRFYEVSCSPTIVDQQCRYLDRRHAAHSKCVQQYSYTYALVRDFGVDYDEVANGGWRLDYIQGVVVLVKFPQDMHTTLHDKLIEIDT